MEILPDAEKAIIPLEKLRDYSLNPDHPSGKHKARVFAAALGMTKNDAAKLKGMISRAVLVNEAVSQAASQHGTRYRVDFDAFGPKGTVTIRTAWIVDREETPPRLTSCYVVG